MKARDGAPVTPSLAVGNSRAYTMGESDIDTTPSNFHPKEVSNAQNFT